MINEKKPKECKLTLYTDDIEGITIGKDGVSNIAADNIWRLKNEVFSGEDRIDRLNKLLKKIKKAGLNKKYDCII